MNIIIKDDLSAEDNAMIQALYSRSGLSVLDHIKKVEDVGSTNFMSNFYIGYGHKSIGDCGTTTIYIENVSILAAKAIQDSPLYSGQESSTRYIDFQSRPMIDPVNSATSKEILNEWMNIYTEYQPIVIAELKRQNPKSNGINQTVYDKAIQSRCFDIMRGFLPSGATTQLSWTTSLSQAKDRIDDLLQHPLLEVRNIANEMLLQLQSKYPSSFNYKLKPDIIKYGVKYSEYIHYAESVEYNGFNINFKTLNFDFKQLDIELMEHRPKGKMLPKHLKKYGTVLFEFLLDYGSFRDIQRHRNGLCEMPLLTTQYGFNEWYLDNLPDCVIDEINARIGNQLHKLDLLLCNKYELQYYIPMGFNVVTTLSYDLPQIAYVLDLRSSLTVHPTLRNIINKIGVVIQNEIPMLQLYMDKSDDELCLKRGLQDITFKETKIIPIE